MLKRNALKPAHTTPHINANQNAKKSRTKRFLLSSSNNYSDTGLFPFGMFITIARCAHNTKTSGKIYIYKEIERRSETYYKLLLNRTYSEWATPKHKWKEKYNKNISFENRNVMKIKTCVFISHCHPHDNVHIHMNRYCL